MFARAMPRRVRVLQPNQPTKNKPLTYNRTRRRAHPPYKRPLRAQANASPQKIGNVISAEGRTLDQLLLWHVGELLLTMVGYRAGFVGATTRGGPALFARVRLMADVFGERRRGYDIATGIATALVCRGSQCVPLAVRCLHRRASA